MLPISRIRIPASALVAFAWVSVMSARPARADPDADAPGSATEAEPSNATKLPAPSPSRRPSLTLGPALVPIGIGAAAGLAGGAAFWLTGASRRVVGPATLLALSGFSLVAIGILLDSYGVAAPRDDLPRPLLDTPCVETSFGYRYVYDPQFAYRSFLTESIDVRWRRLRVAPAAAFAANDANGRLRLLAGLRLLGPTPRPSSPPLWSRWTWPPLTRPTSLLPTSPSTH